MEQRLSASAAPVRVIDVVLPWRERQYSVEQLITLDKMKVKKSVEIAAAMLIAAMSAVADAHNAICDCYESGGKVVCEGGFSDGAKAVGVPIRVVDSAGKVLVEGKMSAKSEFTFAKPKVSYKVEFDAGQGHVVTIDGRDIKE